MKKIILSDGSINFCIGINTLSFIPLARTSDQQDYLLNFKTAPIMCIGGYTIATVKDRDKYLKDEMKIAIDNAIDILKKFRDELE